MVQILAGALQLLYSEAHLLITDLKEENTIIRADGTATVIDIEFFPLFSPTSVPLVFTSHATLHPIQFLNSLYFSSPSQLQKYKIKFLASLAHSSKEVEYLSQLESRIQTIKNQKQQHQKQHQKQQKKKDDVVPKEQTTMFHKLYEFLFPPDIKDVKDVKGVKDIESSNKKEETPKKQRIIKMKIQVGTFYLIYVVVYMMYNVIVAKYPYNESIKNVKNVIKSFKTNVLDPVLVSRLQTTFHDFFKNIERFLSEFPVET